MKFVSQFVNAEGTKESTRFRITYRLLVTPEELSLLTQYTTEGLRAFMAEKHFSLEMMTRSESMFFAFATPALADAFHRQFRPLMEETINHARRAVTFGDTPDDVIETDFTSPAGSP